LPSVVNILENMAKNIRLKKGFDIKIKGNAEKLLLGTLSSSFYGVKPVDFPGLEPKMVAQLGDEVKAGSPLFHDKNVLQLSSPPR